MVSLYLTDVGLVRQLLLGSAAVAAGVAVASAVPDYHYCCHFQPHSLF